MYKGRIRSQPALALCFEWKLPNMKARFRAGNGEESDV